MISAAAMECVCSCSIDKCLVVCYCYTADWCDHTQQMGFDSCPRRLIDLCQREFR